jgi:hypothetical protein
MVSITSIGRDTRVPLRESTLNKSVAITMRMKCLLAITAALIFLGLIATLAYAVIGTVS